MFFGRYSFVLRPLACIYGLGVTLRNFAFKIGLLKERSYPIPVICIGNITVGGTGKTPHVEYVLSKLLPQYRVAVLTRGYGRKSRGQVIAEQDSPVSLIGDEPRQIKLKYPEVIVVVDADRCRAMDYLLALDAEIRPDVVVMDDGLQHRYLKPSYRIMLMDYNRPIDEDHLMPEGNLREFSSARYNMDCIIVTKCPETLKPIERRGIERTLATYPYQQVFFTSIAYQSLAKVSDIGQIKKGEEKVLTKQTPVYAFSGIASAYIFVEYLSTWGNLMGYHEYGDHHNFTDRDIVELNALFDELSAKYPNLLFVCTEKDAVRLVEYLPNLSRHLISALYYLPISISIQQGEEQLIRTINLAARARPQSLQNI